MRKYKKNQLVKMIDTLETANQLLKKIIIKGNREQICDILENEQNAAIAIGEQIERSEGESCKTVRLLEDYCESLWEMSQKETGQEWKFLRKTLVRQAGEIKTAIQGLPEEYQIVFFPYKASMWDCMESVWKAANDDPECSCYVVPVPYCERLPNGSMGEWQCEADLLPGYVPVTDYKEYLLTEEHPEIIYIHNPYDEINLVTSVHPEYYSSNLKKYTDMLVYLPYYVAQNHVPQSHRMLPVYTHADRIILQNECMVDDMDPSIPREKLLVLGSPKAERMICMEMHKEELDVPEEWLGKRKGKKVFFLNISLTSILNEGENRLKKIEEVFNVFSKRNDVILLWRPHPLLEATLKSMRSNLLGAYRALVGRFQRENIGILDRTQDAEQAVAFSDAYIGESSSSIAELFRMVDKPVLFLGANHIYQPTLEELQSDYVVNVCRVENVLWFVTSKLQLLCKLDLMSQTIETVIPLPEVSSRQGERYSQIVHDQGKLYFTPHCADALCVYDIAEGNFKKYYFADEYVNLAFGDAYMYGHELYLVPKDYPAVVSFDTQACCFSYYREGVEKLLRFMETDKGDTLFIWGRGCKGAELYLVTAWSNYIFTFNMDSHTYQIDEMGMVGCSIQWMVSDDRYYWFLLREDAKVVRMDHSTKELTEYTEFPKDLKTGNFSFLFILDFGKDLFLIPYQANHICRLDKETGVISKAGFHLPYSEDGYASEYYEAGGIRYRAAQKISDEEMALFSGYDDSFVMININSGECKILPLRIKDSIKRELSRKDYYPFEMWENESLPMSKYVEYVVQGYPKRFYRKGKIRPPAMTDIFVGGKIHRVIKGLLSAVKT